MAAAGCSAGLPAALTLQLACQEKLSLRQHTDGSFRAKRRQAQNFSPCLRRFWHQLCHRVQCVPGASGATACSNSSCRAKRRKAPLSLSSERWSARHCAQAPSMSAQPCHLHAHHACPTLHSTVSVCLGQSVKAVTTAANLGSSKQRKGLPGTAHRPPACLRSPAGCVQHIQVAPPFAGAEGLS